MKNRNFFLLDCLLSVVSKFFSDFRIFFPPTENRKKESTREKKQTNTHTSVLRRATDTLCVGVVYVATHRALIKRPTTTTTTTDVIIYLQKRKRRICDDATEGIIVCCSSNAFVVVKNDDDDFDDGDTETV